MAILFQVGPNWYPNLSEHGRRMKRSLGPSERLARLKLGEPEQLEKMMKAKAKAGGAA